MAKDDAMLERAYAHFDAVRPHARAEIVQCGLDFATAEVERATADLTRQLRKEESRRGKAERELRLTKRIIERLPLCPDHRDKVRGRCVECDREKAERERDEAVALLQSEADDCMGAILDWLESYNAEAESRAEPGEDRDDTRDG